MASKRNHILQRGMTFSVVRSTAKHCQGSDPTWVERCELLRTGFKTHSGRAYRRLSSETRCFALPYLVGLVTRQLHYHTTRVAMCTTSRARIPLQSPPVRSNRPRLRLLGPEAAKPHCTHIRSNPSTSKAVYLVWPSELLRRAFTEFPT